MTNHWFNQIFSYRKLSGPKFDPELLQRANDLQLSQCTTEIYGHLYFKTESFQIYIIVFVFLWTFNIYNVIISQGLYFSKIMLSMLCGRQAYLLRNNLLRHNITMYYDVTFLFAYCLHQQNIYNRIMSYWHHIPDIALIEIFSYLSDNDRKNASLVCKNWSNLFHTPKLWRRRYFHLGGFFAHLSQTMACKFSRIHGQHLRYLTITCNHPSYHTCKLFLNASEIFLNILKKANLRYFCFRHLDMERFWKAYDMQEALVDNFVMFFKYQMDLTTFEMTSAYMPLLEGCRMLEILASTVGNVLKVLYLEDFFQRNLYVSQSERFCTAMYKFTNLRILVLNYNCISEEILFILALKNRNMDVLRIKVCR